MKFICNFFKKLLMFLGIIKKEQIDIPETSDKTEIEDMVIPTVDTEQTEEIEESEPEQSELEPEIEEKEQISTNVVDNIVDNTVYMLPGSKIDGYLQSKVEKKSEKEIDIYLYDATNCEGRNIPESPIFSSTREIAEPIGNITYMRWHSDSQRDKTIKLGTSYKHNLEIKKVPFNSYISSYGVYLTNTNIKPIQVAEDGYIKLTATLNGKYKFSIQGNYNNAPVFCNTTSKVTYTY